MRSLALVGSIVLAVVASPITRACKMWVPLIQEIEEAELIVAGYVVGNEENKYAVRTYESGGAYDNEQREYRQRWLHEATVVVTDVLKGSLKYPRIETDAEGKRVQSIRVLHDGMIQDSAGRFSTISTDDHIRPDDEGIWLLHPGDVRGTYRRESTLPETSRDEVKRCLEVLQMGYRNWVPGFEPDANTWVTTWGCDMRTHVRAVAHDDGDITLSGVFRGELVDSGQPTLSAPEWDHFISRLDASGRTKWTRALGCGQNFDPSPFAGHSGSTLLVGDFHQACSILGTPMPWKGTKLVVSISSDGNIQWAHTITGIVTGISVLPTARGSYQLVGSFKGELACAGKSIVAEGASDWFVGELAGDGSVRRLQRIANDSNDALSRAELGPKGEIVFAGNRAVSQMQNGRAQNRSDVMVGSMSHDGHIAWTDTLGGEWDDWLHDVAVAPNGMAVATMTLTPSELGRFDPNNIVNARVYPGRSYMGLCAWSADGDRLWSVAGTGYDVEFDADGMLYCAGSYRDIAGESVPSQLPPPAGGVDVFIECYDGEGKRLWSRRDGGMGAESVSSFALLPGRRALLGGGFEGLSYLAGQTLRPHGYLDFFLMSVGLPER